MGVIDFEKAKKKTESAESSESIQIPENLTNPALIAKFKELSEKEKRHENTAAERLRLHRLKKYGDNATGQNKITGEHTNTPSKQISLEKLNKLPLTINRAKAQEIIDHINDGCTMIKACEITSIRPKDFLYFIDDIENKDLKNLYYNARVTLAEWYLEKRERLENDLKSGRIDCSTYSTLANDYKYLAGKLAPLAYGDKIQLDAQIVKADLTESINADKIKQLNSLLNANIIDCEYIESAPARVEDSEKA
jgi:hypothetical protein